MWPTQKIRSGHSEPWTPGMGKPVVPDELAEPQTARLSAEKSPLASPAHAVKKAVYVLCSEPTDELICGGA